MWIVSEMEAEQYAFKYYGITVSAKKLPGEADFNFYLKDQKENEYTLKISQADVEEEELDFQTKILIHLSQKQLPFDLPEAILSSDGRPYIKFSTGGDKERYMRLQKWVSGRMLDDVNPRRPELLRNWGQTAAHLCKALQDFDHPYAHRFYKWDPSETLFSRKFRTHIKNREELEIADYFWQLFEEKASPLLPSLRQGVNYNDAHEHNLLVDNDLKTPLVSGVIDFGDALYTHSVNELAIACAYAGMYKADPVEAICHVVSGFHEVFPLEEKEVQALFGLISARLMITVSNAAWNKYSEPENEYLLVSERPAWDLLKKLRKIAPEFAHCAFRNACGWEACPNHLVFQKWVKDNSEVFAPVMALEQRKIARLDLSVGSSDLGNNTNFESDKAFKRTIDRMLEDKEAEWGEGGYGEVRPFYTTDAYQVEGNSGVQWRTVHLGLDIWAGAGTPVYTPLDGTIHSFQNNKGNRDYGPTIILKHEVSPEISFYTLYGHLSTDSLDGLKKGMVIQKGKKIARIGKEKENGNWPPHLHFQVMLDILGIEGDFPGVAFPSESKIWQSICPDPGLLISNRKPLFSEKRGTGDILKTRQHILGRNLSVSYDNPLHMVRGYMEYLYDTSGRRYLDTVNNVAHVGHEHPRVVKAAQRQMALLNTNTRYLHEHIVSFGEELLSTFPPELSVVHFVNSGSEANELALRMARTFTDQKDMIAVEVGYHGNTGGCVDISSYKFDGKGGKGSPLHTHIVPIPDTYRGLYRDENTAGHDYAAHIQKAIEKVQAKGRNIAGFICESILSCGGQIVLPEGYLKEAYQYVRAVGGLCIADEVQVGFGRAGATFWGYELQDVVPDIVVMGKPIGNGHPLAAVVTTAEVADAFANGMEYFNTFGGNPVSCAIGREVLRIIREDGLQRHAYEVGNYLISGLKDLQSSFSIIGDVRGSGLFLGIELVKNVQTLEPAPEEASYLANRMRNRGILMSTDGLHHNVLKIKPPMCFDTANADFLLENLEKVLSEDFLKMVNG